MKRFLVKSLLLMFAVTQVIGISLTGCKRKETPTPEPSAVIIKFKVPEYKDYILANYVEGEENIYCTRYNNCGEPIGKTGYSPYWELPGEWLLVDWKWSGFPYNAGLTLLTEQTWDKLGMAKTTGSGIPFWSLAEPHIFQPVEKILYINVFHWEKYSGAKYPDELVSALWEHKTEGEIKPCEEPEKMDGYWEILQQDLSAAIKNGDLEHINDDKYAPSR